MDELKLDNYESRITTIKTKTFCWLEFYLKMLISLVLRIKMSTIVSFRFEK